MRDRRPPTPDKTTGSPLEGRSLAGSNRGKARKKRPARRPSLEFLEARTLLAAPPLQVMYVDIDWTGLAKNVDPDGPNGPAGPIGADSFATLADATLHFDPTAFSQIDVVSNAAGGTNFPTAATIIKDVSIVAVTQTVSAGGTTYSPGGAVTDSEIDLTDGAHLGTISGLSTPLVGIDRSNSTPTTGTRLGDALTLVQPGGTIEATGPTQPTQGEYVNEVSNTFTINKNIKLVGDSSPTTTAITLTNGAELVSGSGGLTAATVNIDRVGSPAGTGGTLLANGVTLVAPNGTINLTGTFTEDLNLTQSGVTVQPLAGQSATLVAADDTGGLVASGATGATVTGLTIQPADATGTALTVAATGVTVSGNTFDTPGASELVFGAGGTGATITGNHFTANLVGSATYFNDMTTGGTYNIPAVIAGNTFVRNVSVEETPGTAFLPMIWANIQAGVTAADTSSGDTVRVGIGTYLESDITVGSPMTITGESQAQVTLNPASGLTDSHADSSFGGTALNAFVVQSSGVTIEHLSINGGSGENFRDGIITDYRAGAYGSLTVNDVTMANIFRKGVALYATDPGAPTAVHTTGNTIENSSFTHIGDELDSFESVAAIADFNGDASITGNTISNSGGGIESNILGGNNLDAPVLTVSGNQVTAPLTSGGMIGLGLDLSGLAGGSQIVNNTIDTTGHAGVDYGMVIQYAVTGLHTTISGNAITVGTGDTALVLYADADATNVVTVTGNTISGSGTAVGVLVTDDGTVFGDTPSSGTTHVALTANTISGFTTGISVTGTGTGVTTAAIGDGTTAGRNAITGGGVGTGTGIVVMGPTATATIAGNTGSIAGWHTGIDVNGGTASITGNHIDDNTTGIVLENGAVATAISGNDFSNATPNSTDLQILDTSTVTAALTSNVFDASGFFIDEASTGQAIVTALSTLDTADGGTNTYTGAANFFTIETRIHDRVDTDRAIGVGLVVFDVNNVFVTTPTLNSTDSSIQRGIDAVPAPGTGWTVNVQAGTYVVNDQTLIPGAGSLAGLVVDKPITLLGPNASFDPTSSTTPSAPQAIIEPGTSNPNVNTSTTEVVVDVTSSNVTIRGLTISGSNDVTPGFVHNGGVTLNGTPIDAGEGIASYTNVGNITIQGNLVENTSYTGIDFNNDVSGSGGATTGNLITDNLVEHLSDAYGFGVGVLISNNFYADVTSNVMTDLRVGVQTGNFSQANPAVSGSDTISDNTITANRVDIFYNLMYGSSSPFTVANNTIHAGNDPADAPWKGIRIDSIQDAVGATFLDNTIDGSGGVQTGSVGYDVWNAPTTGSLMIVGGSVTGVDYGVWANSFEGFNSDGAQTSIAISRLTITNPNVAGVYVEDSPQNTSHPAVSVTLASVSITGAPTGVLVSGANASVGFGTGDSISGGTTGLEVDSATAGIIGNTLNNLTFSGQSGNYITLTSGALAGETVDATGASFGGQLGSATTDATGWPIEDKISDALDTSGLGYVRLKNGFVYVTPTNGTPGAVGRGVAVAIANDHVDLKDGTYVSSNVIVTQPITIDGQSEGGVMIVPAGEDDNVDSTLGGTSQIGFIVQSSNVTIEDLTLNGQGNAALTAGKNNFRAGIVTQLTGSYDNLTVQDTTVEHIFRRGIQISTSSTGGQILDNTVTDVSDPFKSSYGIATFGGSATIQGNVISDTFDGIAANADPTSPFQHPLLTVQGNTITASSNGIYLSAVQSGSLIGGPGVSDGNSVTTPGVTGKDNTGILITFANGPVTLQGNTINASAGDTGIELFFNALGATDLIGNHLTATSSVVDSAAVESGAGTATGVFITDDNSLLGESAIDATSATFEGNTITGFARGIDVYRNGSNASHPNGAPLTVTIGGAGVGVGNTISGATTGIRVFDANGTAAANATVTIIGGSVSGTTAGVDIDGGTASITGTSVSTGASGTGISVEDGGALTVGAGDSITGGTTGLSLSGSTAAVTGDTLNNLVFSGQSGNTITLGSGALLGQTLDATGASFGGNVAGLDTTADLYGVEDTISDVLDAAGTGYVKLKSGNVYVTPGSDTTSNGAIQRAIGVASPGDTLHIAGGSFTGSVDTGTKGLVLSLGDPAQVTITGNLTLHSTDTLDLEIDGSLTPGTSYDQLVVSGTVSLGGATLNTAASTITGSHFGDTLTIINNTGSSAVSGTFAGSPEASYVTVNGETFQIFYDGGDGNDVVLVNVPNTPTRRRRRLTTVYADSSWSTLANGTQVTATFDGSKHYIGIDAFATITAGVAHVASGGTVDVDSGIFTESNIHADQAGDDRRPADDQRRRHPEPGLGPDRQPRRQQLRRHGLERVRGPGQWGDDREPVDRWRQPARTSATGSSPTTAPGAFGSLTVNDVAMAEHLPQGRGSMHARPTPGRPRRCTPRATRSRTARSPTSATSSTASSRWRRSPTSTATRRSRATRSAIAAAGSSPTSSVATTSTPVLTVSGNQVTASADLWRDDRSRPRPERSGGREPDL